MKVKFNFNMLRTRPAPSYLSWGDSRGTPGGIHATDAAR